MHARQGEVASRSRAAKPKGALALLRHLVVAFYSSGVGRPLQSIDWDASIRRAFFVVIEGEGAGAGRRVEEGSRDRF